MNTKSALAKGADQYPTNRANGIHVFEPSSRGVSPNNPEHTGLSMKKGSTEGMKC